MVLCMWRVRKNCNGNCSFVYINVLPLINVLSLFAFFYVVFPSISLSLSCFSPCMMTLSVLIMSSCFYYWWNTLKNAVPSGCSSQQAKPLGSQWNPSNAKPDSPTGPETKPPINQPIWVYMVTKCMQYLLVVSMSTEVIGKLQGFDPPWVVQNWFTFELFPNLWLEPPILGLYDTSGRCHIWQQLTILTHIYIHISILYVYIHLIIYVLFR